MEGAVQRHPEFAIRWIGLTALISGCILPLIRSRQLNGTEDLRLADLSATRWSVGALALVLIAASALECRGIRSSAAATVARITALVGLVTTLLTLIVLESLAAFLTPDAIPKTLQRFAIGAEALPGIWLLITGNTLVLLSTSTWNDEAVGRLRLVWTSLRERSLAGVGLVVGVIGIVALLITRQTSWIRASTPLGEALLQGNALPVIGPASLIVAVATITAIGCAIIRPNIWSGTTLVTLGWLVTLPAAIILALLRTQREAPLPDWLNELIATWVERAQTVRDLTGFEVPAPDGAELSLSAARGSFAVFATGLAIAAAGILMLWSARHAEPQRWEADDDIADESVETL